jgi:hypothetical protein
MTVQGQHASVRGSRPSSKTSLRGPRNLHYALIILGHAKQGLCSTEPLCPLNKPSSKHIQCEGAPHGRGDAVRGITYPGPDHYNCRKSYCRQKAGREQGSQPPWLGLAVTIPLVGFLAVR